jgi:membrane-bound serine protease (ClpP class)
VSTALAIALTVLLVIGSLVFVFFEIITPTFGPLAALGVASAVGAVAVAATVSRTAAVVLAIGLVVALPAYVILLVKLMPRLPLAKGLFLQKVPDATGAASPDAATLESLVGKEGLAETLLRPSGAVRVGGRRIIARAESGLIPKGSAVRIVSASGTDVIVRKI